MSKKHFWHHNLLSTTAIGISLVTVYSVIEPDAGHHSVADFTFPQSIPLSSWNNTNNQSIAIASAPDNQDNVIHSANLYQYQESQQNAQLDVAMYYVTDTRGDVKSFFLEQTEIAPEILATKEIKQQGNSYYSIFNDSDRTYLSTCLNPTGNSTVTQKQFSQSLNQRPIDLKLLKDWLLGKASIRDRRCLWITISTSNRNLSSTEPEEILQTFWQSWDTWWKPRFPSL